VGLLPLRHDRALEQANLPERILVREPLCQARSSASSIVIPPLAISLPTYPLGLRRLHGGEFVHAGDEDQQAFIMRAGASTSLENRSIPGFSGPRL
jgi:hypothetical protein